MSLKPPSLAERRQRLIVLVSAQRKALAAELEPWRRPVAMVDQGIALARFVKAHPVWILGGVVAPGSSRLGAWLRRGFVALRIVRQLRDRHSSA